MFYHGILPSGLRVEFNFLSTVDSSQYNNLVIETYVAVTSVRDAARFRD